MGDDLARADLDFARDALGIGLKGTLAAIVVGAQGFIRAFDNRNMPKQRLRTSAQKAQQQGKAAPPRPGPSAPKAAPVAISTRRTGRSPRMNTTKEGVIVAHRAFLGPITCESAFTTNYFPCNPAHAQTFPWLSRLASRFDKYRFHRLRFEYRSVCATSLSGLVMLSFDFDAQDAAPTSKTIASQTTPNSENNCWMNNTLDIPLDPQWRFTRQGTETGDVKNFDLGNLWVSTLYGTGATTGELYVEYVVELAKPTDAVEISGHLDGGGVLADATPLGTAATATGKAVPWQTYSSSTITFGVAGDWMVVQIAKATVDITAWADPTITNGSVISTLVTTLPAGAGNYCMKIACVRADRGSVMTVGGKLTTNGLNYYRVYISPYAGAYF